MIRLVSSIVLVSVGTSAGAPTPEMPVLRIHVRVPPYFDVVAVAVAVAVAVEVVAIVVVAVDTTVLVSVGAGVEVDPPQEPRTSPATTRMINVNRYIFFTGAPP
jgi:hypothetical protein